MSPLVSVLGSSVAPVLLLVLKATLLLGLAGAASVLLPRKAAAARHLVWTLAVVMLLVLPAATLVVPHWRLAVPVALPEGTVPAAFVASAGETVRSGPLGSAEAPVPSVPGASAEAPARSAPTSPATEANGGARGSALSDGSTWWAAALLTRAREAALSRAGGLVTSAREALTPAALRRHAATPVGLLVLWAAGAWAILAWLLVGRVALYVVRLRATPLGADWDVVRRDAAWLLDLDRPVRLYRSRSVSTPVTWGVVRPVVMLPEEAETWPEERRRVVLLHELSHVARRDCLTQLVAVLACAAWWFHPGAWYAARRMRVEREHACDDLVLGAGTPAADYAAHLLELARCFRRAGPSPLVALPMARPSHLEGRLLRVLAGATGRRPPTRLGVGTAAAAMLLLTTLVSSVRPALAAAPSQGDAAGTPAAAAASASAGTAAASASDSSDAVVEITGQTPASGPAAAATDGAGATAAADPPAIAERAGVSAETPGTSSRPVVAGTMVSDTPPPARRDRDRATGIVIDSNADSIARVVRRVAVRDAAFAITSQDGRTMLLLRDSTMVLQLTDRGLDEIGRGDHGDDDERGLLSALLGSMLRGGLRVLLDHGIEYSLTDLREARYENGRLLLESRRGRDVFENVQVDGRNIMEGFSPRDARAFAARANAARARLRR